MIIIDAISAVLGMRADYDSSARPPSSRQLSIRRTRPRPAAAAEAE